MLIYDWVTKGKEPPKETYFKEADFITRENYKKLLVKHGFEEAPAQK